ncbi:MAG: NADH:ubiquinone reductase (Na(+)-transporting) subunit F [Cytophagia bacterium]|nr:NADH:ubiquinone reductase (Na(+)-transporting) subunit F [Cytophagia bacterium]
MTTGFIIRKVCVTGKVMNWLNAMTLVTVPKISVILRKSYGLAVSNMGAGGNTDEVACWVTAEISFMKPDFGAKVVFGVDPEKEPEKFKEDWDKFKLWDLKMVNPEPIFRAYSMANHPAEGNIIKLNIRIATPPWDRASNAWMKVNPGVCSSFVFNCKPGDKVTISGPYGEFFIKDTQKEMVYVGGGAGMAPLRAHIFHLFHTLKTGRKVSYWYGGRSKRELFYVDEFRAIEKEFPNFRFHVVLSEPLPEDNWKVCQGLDGRDGDGFLGFVHQSFIDNYLSKHKEPEEIEFYFCGPPMMNAAVLKMCDDWGIPKEHVAFDDFGG